MLPIVIVAIWDHPRIRGKDKKLKRSIGYRKGSPPHTRERLSNRKLEFAMCRITPAYAGKTAQEHPLLNEIEDHPRIRGKDFLLRW